MKANTSGTNPLPNEIQNTQTQTGNFDASHIICNSDGTIDVKGQLVFDPPQPVADTSKIFSPDMSSQLQCINGGQITVLGTLQGYSTTAQTNSSIGTAIGDLSSVYVAQTTPLDQITQPTGTLQMNNQQIDGLADPNDLQMAVNLQYLQNNYSDTTQSQSFVNNAIGDLSSVYQSINTTLDAIPLAENNVNVNNFKIVNLLPGTQPTDAVNLSQLDGYIPISGNINDLTAQTADYDTSGFQITVSNPPSAVDDLTNKQYVDGEISALSSVYQSINTTLDAIPVAQNNVDFNGQKLQNIGFAIDQADAVSVDYLQTYYLTSGESVNIFQSIAGMVNYVQTSFLTSNYTNNTVLQSTYALISSLSNYVLSSTLTSTLANYTSLAYLQANYLTQTAIEASYATLNDISGFVLESFVTDNYYNKAWIDGNFASISSLSSYVLTSTLNTVLSGYVTSAQLAIDLQSYATEAYVQAYTYSRSYIDSNFALISSLASYVTNSSLATSLSGYLQIANIGQYTTAIQTNSSGTKSKVNCATNSEILFNIADVQKLRMYVPAGQSTQPLGLIADDKIQMVSGENSFSLTGQKALQAKPTQNFSGLYISGLDNAALNVGQQIQIGSQFCQKLALASGHTDIGGGTQVLYSTISNSAEGVAQQNLQISGGTPQTDNTLVLYSDSYAAALGQNLTAQFTKKTGYSTTTAITEANQFSSKTYVDSAVSGLSSVYLTIANAASTYLTIANAASTYLTIANAASTYLTISNAASTYQTIANMSNYYTKAVTDATFATITSLSNYVTNSSLTTTLSSYLTISNAASTYQTIADMSNYYTKTVADSTFATIASLSGYLPTSTTLNNIAAPTGSLNMNSQKIISCLDPTLAQDVATKNYVDTQGASGITLATAKANFIALDGTQTALITAPIPMNGQKITGLGNATAAGDALNRQTADGRYYLDTTRLNGILAPNGSLSLNSQKITNLATGTVSTDAANTGQITAVSTGLNTFTGKFRASLVTVGVLNLTTTPTAVTSVSGFVTSATKQIAPFSTSTSTVVTINYANAGYIPLIIVTPQTNGIPTAEQQNVGLCAYVTAVSTTQASIIFASPSGNRSQLTTTIYSLNILAMDNTLT